MESDFTFAMAEMERCFDPMFAHAEFWNYISGKVREKIDCVDEKIGKEYRGRCYYLLDVCCPFYKDFSEAKDKCKSEKLWKDSEKDNKFVEINQRYLPVNQEKVIENGCLLGHLNLASTLYEESRLYKNEIDYLEDSDEDYDEIDKESIKERIKWSKKKIVEIEAIIIPMFKMLSDNSIPISDGLLGLIYSDNGDNEKAVIHLKRALEIFEEKFCCYLSECYGKLSKNDLSIETWKFGATYQNCSTCANRIVNHFHDNNYLVKKDENTNGDYWSNLCHYFHVAAIKKDRYHYYNKKNLSAHVLNVEVNGRKLQFERLKSLYNKYKDKIDFQEEYLRMVNIIETGTLDTNVDTNVEEKGKGERKISVPLKIGTEWARDVIAFLITETSIRSIFLKETKSSLTTRRLNNWINQSTILNRLPPDLAKICHDYLFTLPSFYDWKLFTNF
jgi:tetratricopeptide (TPR) repeat protein